MGLGKCRYLRDSEFAIGRNVGETPNGASIDANGTNLPLGAKRGGRMRLGGLGDQGSCHSQDNGRRLIFIQSGIGRRSSEQVQCGGCRKPEMCIGIEQTFHYGLSAMCLAWSSVPAICNEY